MLGQYKLNRDKICTEIKAPFLCTSILVEQSFIESVSVLLVEITVLGAFYVFFSIFLE